MRVSVIIPSHNRADTVVMAVQSVLWQTHPDCEIIVVDDGSDDDTAQRLEPYEGRIRLLRQARRGPSAARNAGAAAATGEWLAFLDSDDLWLPWHLSNQLALLAGLGATVPCCVANAWICNLASGGSLTSFDDAGLVLHRQTAMLHNPLETLAGRFLLFNQTTTMRRDAFVQAGGYRESLWLLEDYQLALHLARMGPWALVRVPSVVKENRSDGLGVSCMNDRSRHDAARRRVLQQVLDDPQIAGAKARCLLHLALRSIPAGSGCSALSARVADGWRLLHRLVRRGIGPDIRSQPGAGIPLRDPGEL